MERLLEKNENIKDVVSKINELVDKDFDMLGKTDDDIVKWQTIPELIGLNEDMLTRLKEFVTYLDRTRLPMREKSLIIISLSGLIKYFNLDITKYDDGNLYLISNHYQNTKVEDMKKTINIINNNSLLLAVRNMTLDLNDRKVILRKIEYKVYEENVDTSNIKELNDFLTKEIEILKTMDYYK